MYAGGGGADWGSGCTFLLMAVVPGLLGSNFPAKLGSDTQGGLLAVAGPEWVGPAAGAGAEGEVRRRGGGGSEEEGKKKGSELSSIGRSDHSEQ